MDAVFDQGPPTPCPAPFNMAAYILAHASDLSDKTALEVLHSDNCDSWSFSQLETTILGTATGLLQQGLTPGDRVLMRLGNTVSFPITYLAAISVGLIPVPTSAQLTSGEIGKIAAEIEPRLIVADANVALPQTTTCPVLPAHKLDSMKHLPPAQYALGDPERPAYIIYTSGTAGKPRAVVHAHRAIWARRMMWDGWYGLKQSDRLMHAGAFNWTYTLGTGLMDPWSVGATALIPGEDIGTNQIPVLLARYKATIFAAAPGIYRQILTHPLPDLPDLRHGLSAGEKLPEATLHAWRAATDKKIYEAFGMSECSTFISSSPTKGSLKGSLGIPQPGRRVAILGGGGPVKQGTPGTISVSNRDPGLMLGYLNADHETRAKFRGEWFLTGDTGQMDKDGSITYLGRDDDMMNAGGFRVSPIEVEHAMRRHPGISDCAAVEVEIKPDVTVIAAFYTGSGEIDVDLLCDHAAVNLARYKQPRVFVYQTDLPRGANNKLLRKQLRETYEIPGP